MSPVSPFTFAGLPAYSRADLDLWNWFVQAFPGVDDWKRWLSGTFAGLIQKPAGWTFQLTETHCVDLQQPAREFSFARSEISIGREPQNDIVLNTRAVARRHARIFLRDGQHWLEDTGSGFGTYLGQRRLATGEPVRLHSGERFIIFPHAFSFDMARVWEPDNRIDIDAAPAQIQDWSAFSAATPANWLHFEILVHPLDLAARMAVDRAFVEQFTARLLHEPATPGLAGADHGLIEFFLLAVLEAANRDLRFPFLSGLAQPSSDVPGRGISVAFSVGFSDLTGAFRIFFPCGLLAAMRPAATRVRPAPHLRSVSWRFPLTAGRTDLTCDEFSGLELNDILLFSPEPELLFPPGHDRGWKCSQISDNPWRVHVDNYWERGCAVENVPDLGSLPIQLLVVLGEKELTLADVEGLAAGSILELDTGREDPVRLAVNGKCVGQGVLVEIEGKLGVRITRWGG